jgi:hypothetical protein
MHCALHQNREKPLLLLDAIILTPCRSTQCHVVLSSLSAAHSLYEKTRPDILHGPGGALLSDARYEQLLDDRTVRVRGSRFQSVEQGQYTVKLESARAVGYFSVFIGQPEIPSYSPSSALSFPGSQLL